VNIKNAIFLEVRMQERFSKKIAWLDDEHETISRCANYLEEKHDFKIDKFLDSTKLIDEAKKNPELDSFIIDFRILKKDLGIETANTLMYLRPDIPIVAVTQFLMENAFDVATGLTMAKPSPFSLIWEKKYLNDVSNIKRFATELEMICRKEYHKGTVIKVEPDYTHVRLVRPNGSEYERFFESAFLQGCQISKAGDRIGVLFWKIANGNSGEVHVRVTKLDEYAVDTTAEEVKEAISAIDMGKIREKFPPQTVQ
jgi:hypothetical protein